MFEAHVADVVADMKGRVVLPGRMTDAQWRHDDPLAIARDKRHARLKEGDARCEWNDAVKDRHPADVQRRFFGLQIQEDRVFRTEPVAGIKMRHVTILL